MTGRGTIAFSRDGLTIFTWGSPVVQAWDRATGKERFAVRHTENCWDAAESPDGKILATASYDNFVRFWSSADGRETGTPLQHPGQVLTVSFSPDGRRVGTSCGDWQSRVWDASTGALLYGLSTDGWPTSVRFTPDGRYVLNAGASGVQVHDARTGTAVARRVTTASGAIPYLDVSADGRWAVVAGTDRNYFVRTDLQLFNGKPRYSSEEALLWTELLSHSRITGSDAALLLNADWLERWEKYRKLHPEIAMRNELFP